MGRRFRDAGVLVALLLLLGPASFLNTVSIPAAHAQSAAPVVAPPVRLTNTSFNNYLAPSSEAPGANGVFNAWKGGRARATGGVVAWSSLLPNNGQVPNVGTGISYSTLNTTTGRLQAQSLSFSTGEGYPSTDANYESVFSDQGAILVNEVNQATGAKATLIFNTADKTSVDAPNPPSPLLGAGYPYGAQFTFSSWGRYAVAMTTYPRLTSPSGLMYNTTEISALVGNSWQQVTPNDWSVQNYNCGGSTSQTLVDLARPSQVLARGQGQYAWIRVNSILNYTGPPGCLTPVAQPVSTDIVLDNGRVAESFPVGAKIYNGTPCTSGVGSTCLEGLVGAWGNIILYDVVNVPPSGVCCQYNLWIYDASTGSKTFIANGGSPYYVDYPNYWSDGKDFVWTGSFAKTLILYDPILGLKRFNQTATFARVGAGWAVWLNNTNYFNFYNIAKQTLYSVNANKGTSGQTSGVGAFDFSDGVAAWVAIEAATDQKSSPICNCVITTIPRLYIVNAPQLNAPSKNLSSVTTTVDLSWAKPFPASGGGSRYVLRPDMIVSKGWVFLTGIPTDSNYFQVFAFQPLSGSVGVTETGKFLPLKEVKVDVLQYNGAVPTLVATTYTDSAGKFSLLLPGSLSTANPPFAFRVNLTQQFGRFAVMDYSGNRSAFPPDVTNSTVTFQTQDLNAIKVGDNLVVLDAANMVRNAVMGTSASRLSYVETDAYIYYRVHQAYELARDYFNADGIFNRMLQVRAFAPGTTAYFYWAGTTPYLLLPASRLSLTDPSVPGAIWHEFGHAVMWFSAIGGVDNFPANTGANHGGYANPDSSDAWTEAWAEYYSALVAHYVDMRPDAQLYRFKGGGVVNFDNNVKVWGWLEEFSVASILWGMTTPWTGNYNWAPGAGQNSRPNAANIPLMQLWQGLNANDVRNTYQLWKTFKGIAGVNETFVAHDVYNDTNGNGRWNPGEPIGTTSWAVITTATGIVHATTNAAGIADARAHHYVQISNANRANRPEVPFAPGSGVLLDFTDSETGKPIQGMTVIVSVSGLGSLAYSYNFTLQQGSSIFYLYLPAGSNETASVTVGAPGYTTTRQFSVTSDGLQSNILANLYQNQNTPYIMNLNESFLRDHSVQVDFPFTAVSGASQYTVDVVSNSTITDQGFDSPSSTITFQSFTPSGQRGLVNVTMPRLMNNGTFTVTVNGSPATSTVTGNSYSRSLLFGVPSGRGTVSVRLTPSSSRGTQTSTTTSSTATTSAAPTSISTSPLASQTSTSSAAQGGGIPEFPFQVMTATLFSFILVVSYVLARRRSEPRSADKS